jgi:predicted RNA-binding protein YlxR (DUF448 family)/ribosomal protein L30E
LDLNQQHPMAKPETMRRCIATRQSLPTSRMVRFVLAPDRSVVPDLAGKLPGRGLWLSARRDIVDKACSADLFAKMSGGNVELIPDLSDRLERLLVARCFDLLGLARRASQAIAGAEKVRGFLRAGKGAVVVLASDGPVEERRSMAALAPSATVIEAFDGAELGRVFGRERVVYVAVGHGPFAERLVDETRRLAGFRSLPGSGKLH